MPVNKKSRDRINCLLRLMKENRYPNHTLMVKEMQKLDLAGAYQISAKTIQRDIVYLKSEFNAPIEYSPEYRGYYLTNPYWEKYVPFLEEHEMDSAIIGARLAETILPPSRIGDEIRKGTDALWSRNNGSSDDFMLLGSLVAHGSRAKIEPEIFQTVFEAWQNHQCLRTRYRRVGDGHILDMTIEPHVLTLFDNVWYLKARLLRTGEFPNEKMPFLVFALHRFRGALPLSGIFEPDRKVIEEVNAGYLFDLPRLPEVKLQVRGSAANYGMEYLPIANTEQNADDSLTLTLQGIEEFRVLNYVLTSGGDAVILSPESLKQKALDMAKNVIRNQENPK